MNRKAQIFVVLLAAAVSVGGAVMLATRRAGSTTPATASTSRQIKDMTDRPVALPAHPQRVLSLCTTATDTLLTLGAGDRLVGIDEFSRVVPGTENIQVIGKGSALSRERAAALRIDLAFVWWYQDDAAAMLTELGIPVVRLRSGRASELPATIRLIGDCMNQRDGADRLARNIESFLAGSSTSPGTRVPRVFIELYGPYKTAGSDTYTHDLLTLAGMQNVAADARGSVVFSVERLVQADPDVILCVGGDRDAAALAARPALASLRAVREKRVLPVDRCWTVAGPHLPDSAAKLRERIETAIRPSR